MFFTTTIRDAVAETAAGRRRCAETVADALARISDADPSIRAFTSVQAGPAMRRAGQLDSLGTAGRKRLPLLGVPVAVKDNICTRNVPTTCCSRMLQNFTPPYDAAVIEMIEAAGAVVVGKTNLDEFAMGSSTETSLFGTTRNPCDRERVAGGSSGGSAAAVAAGMVPAALGSDTGGSIRQPCSHCGAAGVKPTYGRVSRFGLVAFASSLDHIGPIAADVRDLSLLLEVLSQPDSRDSTHCGKRYREPEGLFESGVRGMRIGLPVDYFGDGLSAPVAELMQEVKRALERNGACFVDVSLPGLAVAVAAYYIICSAEASSNLARYDGVRYGYRGDRSGTLDGMYGATRHEGFGAEVKRRIMLGTYVLSSGYYDAYYLKAAKVRTLITRDFDRAFTGCDAVFSPVAPTPAFRIGEKYDDPLQMYLTDLYTVSANLAGIPAISVPCGVVGTMPVGAQFMAPKWREDILFRLGYAVQEIQR